MGGQRGVTRAIEHNPLRAMLDEVLGFGRRSSALAGVILGWLLHGNWPPRPITKLNSESSNQISRHLRQAIIEKKPNQSHRNLVNRNRLQISLTHPVPAPATSFRLERSPTSQSFVEINLMRRVQSLAENLVFSPDKYLSPSVVNITFLCYFPRDTNEWCLQ